MMDRRKFMGLMAAAPVSAAAVVPEMETLKIGDIFTVPGYYAVNPLTLKCTELLQVFTVTEVDRYGLSVSPNKD